MTAPVPAQYARPLGLAVAGGRALLGAVAMVAPDVVARPWVGAEGSGPQRRVLARALAGRDLALGIGALIADRRGAGFRGWVEGGVLADCGDVVATLVAFPHLPKWGRFVVLAAAGGAAAAGGLAAPNL
ncbi:MAG TPA: hypothetical protein VFP54_08835 [Acidimicrobiales bacterium]|nr:hypothetical protein [Acidimicrobiales bacterium]